MAGPLVFWPNRKSRLGIRTLSNLAKRASHRAWFTTPPIAEDTMKEAAFEAAELNRWIMGEQDKRKRIRLVLEKVGPDLLAAFDDVVLEASEGNRAARELEDRLADLKRVEGSLLDMKRTVEAVRRELAAVSRENDEKTADLRALRKEIDPEEIKLRIMYATDDALIAKNAELAKEKAFSAALTSRVAELERSKKRLREALDRLSRNT